MTVQLWEVHPGAGESASPLGLQRPTESDAEVDEVFSWDVPTWARVSEVEDVYILHTRSVGELIPVAAGPMRIFLRQADNIEFADGAATIHREPLRISVCGEILTPVEVKKLRRLLDRALTLAG